MGAVMNVAVREHIAKFAAGEITLGEFREWLGPVAWADDGDSDGSAMIHGAELLVAEYLGGSRSLESLELNLILMLAQ